MTKKKSLQTQYREMAQKSQRNMEDCIRKHLELNAALDKNFKEAYMPEKFGDCIKFVVECAEEILGGKSGSVDEDTCYKMARDFFLDRLWEESDDKEEEVKEAVKVPQEVKETHVEQKKPLLKAIVKKSVEKVKKPAPMKILDQIDMFSAMGVR